MRFTLQSSARFLRGYSERKFSDTLPVVSVDPVGINNDEKLRCDQDNSLVIDAEHDDQTKSSRGDDQEGKNIARLPLEIWLMIKKYLNGLEIELLIKTCRALWYSRSDLEDSRLYLDAYYRGMLASE